MTRCSTLDSTRRTGYGQAMTVVLRLVVVFVAMFGAAAVTRAQTYTVQTITVEPFGVVASATIGTTVFRILSNANTRSVVSGSGGLIGSTAATRSTVTIRCVNGTPATNNCNVVTNLARIKIGSNNTFTGRAQTTSNYTVTAGSGVTLGAVTTNGDGSIEFTMGGWTASAQNRTFTLGMNIGVNGNDVGGTTGAATSSFYARAAKNPTTPVTGISQNATITVRRSIVVTKLSDLAFGTMLVPTGSGSVIINPTTGARTTSGTAPTLITGPLFGRAAYTITGESGSTFTITVPATFTMTNGTTTLTVTTSRSNAAGTYTLTGGTFSFGMGGTLPVTAATTRGQYTGSVTLTMAYN